MKTIMLRFSDEEYSHFVRMVTMTEDTALQKDEVIVDSDLDNFLRSMVMQYMRHKKDKFKKISDLPIKNKLEEILKKRTVEQYDFAKIVGVTPSTISLICNQKIEPSLDVALRICDALGLHIYDIFYRDQNL